MGGSSGAQKTTSEPWSGQKDYLSDIYAEADKLGKWSSVGPYQGDTIANLSSYTQQAIPAMANYGASPTAYMQSAQANLGGVLNSDYLNTYRGFNPELAKTASGAYLDAGNPYMQNAMAAAAEPMKKAFNETVMPALDARFAMAGRYGSPGAHAAAANRAANDMMTQLNTQSTNMAYQGYDAERARQEAASGQLANIYNQERSNQMQAIGMTPGQQQADIQRLGLLGQAGQTEEGYWQRELDDQARRYQETRDEPWERLARWNSMITGAGTPGYTTTSTGGGGGNAGMGALGGAMAGAGTGAAVGGPWGALIGAGVGAAGGYAASR